MTIVGAVVVIVTKAVEAVAPLGVTELGVTAQVACVIVAGSAQLKLTVWLNPPCDATESVNVAVPPALTVADCWPVVVTAKSSPVPESATICGLPGDVSVMTRLPVRVPPAVGLKVTMGEQLPPGDSVPHVFDATAKSPVALSPEIVTADALAFVSVMVCGALVVPATCGAEKLTEVEPVKPTICGLPCPSSLMVTDP